jgi:hypothetical protein
MLRHNYSPYSAAGSNNSTDGDDRLIYLGGRLLHHRREVSAAKCCEVVRGSTLATPPGASSVGSLRAHRRQNWIDSGPQP